MQRSPRKESFISCHTSYLCGPPHIMTMKADYLNLITQTLFWSNFF